MKRILPALITYLIVMAIFWLIPPQGTGFWNVFFWRVGVSHYVAILLMLLVDLFWSWAIKHDIRRK